MWWDYVIIFAALGAAVVYVIWFIQRAFSGKAGCGCGSGACAAHHDNDHDHAHDHHHDHDDRQVKVRPLVQINTEK